MSAPLPTIALVTPSYNQAGYLRATLQSVLSQGYPSLEYVVIDGGSQDGSRDIIAEHAGQLSSWCSEPDGGMYAAINKGFARTRGEIMGWLNSDDLLFPGALRAVGEIFAQFPDVTWLSSLTLSTCSSGGTCRGFSALEGYSRTAFLEGGYLPGGARQYGWIPQESTFWRRSLWEQAGGHVDASLKFAGDFELWSRFYAHAELVGTPTPLGAFRSHAAQKSRQMEDYLREARPILARAARGAGNPPLARRLILRSRLAAWPGLRGLCARHWGYSGRRVIAQNDTGWTMENYRFL